MIATLRQRNFALLWLATLISRAGDWVLSVGLPIYVFLLTRSVLATSIMVLAGQAPGILLGSVAGIFVDRWSRQRTLVVVSALLAAGLVPLLLVRSADRVWIVYVVAAVESCLEQFQLPAQNALLPALVTDERLASANSLLSTGGYVARLAGPAIGGFVAAIYGLPGIVLADAASFLLAGALIALVSGVRSQATARVESALTDVAAPSRLGRTRRDWVEGLRVIASSRTLAVLLLAFSFTALGEGVFAVLYPVFVNRVLHGGALQIGELMSAQAVGGLIGTLLIGWIGSRVTSRWAIGLCGAAFGLIDLAIFNSPAVYPAFWLSVALFAAVGVPGIAALTGEQTLLQQTSPGAYRGRVFGALGTLMALFAVVGILLAGTLTDHLGVVTVLNIQGGGYVLAGVLLLLLLPRRQHRSPQPSAPLRDREIVPSEA